MSDIRDSEFGLTSDFMSGGIAGHDLKSLEAHNPANKPKRVAVGIEVEIETYLKRDGKITDFKDGRYYFNGPFGAIQFTKDKVSEEFFTEVVLLNLKD
jgi:hypothetical protein